MLCRKMSAISLEPCIPLEMEPEVLEDLVDKAKDYALMHGECYAWKLLVLKVGFCKAVSISFKLQNCYDFEL